MLLYLAAFFLFSLLFLGWMFLQSFQYQINRHSTQVPKKLTQPLSILHLSDIHFCGQDKYIEKFFEKIGQETYDFVFVTGDIFDCPRGKRSAAFFKKIKSRYGIYAVFGNHDYFNYGPFDMVFHYTQGQGKPNDAQPGGIFEKALRDAGVRLLRNETVEVDVNGTPILIHGLDDPVTGRANVRQAMLNFNRKKLNILLTHSIDVFLDIGEGEIDLSFSGHSHGGQVCLPGIGPILTHTMLGRQYASGLKTLKGAVCSISRGVGTSRFYRIRLLCQPEAIALQVTSSSLDRSESTQKTEKASRAQEKLPSAHKV